VRWKKKGNVGGIIQESIVWYYKEKSRRSYIVEMLVAVSLPVGRTLKREKKIHLMPVDNWHVPMPEASTLESRDRNLAWRLNF